MQRKSLPLASFPPKLQLAMKRLESSARGRTAYSKASIRSAENALGQYLLVCHREGLPLELSSEGLAAFIDDMDDRNLRNSTKLTYTTHIQAIAKLTKYSASGRALILEDCAVYRDGMRLEVPRKVHALTANPLTLTKVAEAAVDWRARARAEPLGRNRRTYFHRSGILALLALTPLRIGDANSLEVGKHVLRSSIGWTLLLPSAKSGFRHNGELHTSLTPYLDDLILMGSDEPIVAAYLRRRGTPLFAGDYDKPLSGRTLPYSFKVATGHSPHIVRTLVHDELAEYGAQGAHLARVLCGHRSPATAKHYEVHADRLRAQKAQECVAQIQERVLRSVKPQARSENGTRLLML